MNEPSPDYYAYLLRLFQVVEQGKVVWRISLQEPGSEQNQKFTSVQEFVEFIVNKTGQPIGYIFQPLLVERKENESTTIEIKLVITSSTEEQELRS